MSPARRHAASRASSERPPMKKTYASYDKLVADLKALGPDDMLVAVELTPELASEILARDPINRTLDRPNVEKLKREIETGHWDWRKSTLGFYEGRLADGQHRCVAVTECGRTILTNIAPITELLGLDEGKGRTLQTVLDLDAHMTDKTQRDMATVVTKRLYREKPNPNLRELYTFYKEHRTFILECVQKPAIWLEGKPVWVIQTVKPTLLATVRAEVLMADPSRQTEVDQFLEDICNAGSTAPAGSTRERNAQQIYNILTQARERNRGVRLKDFRHYLETGLTYNRKDVTKNITMARGSGRKRPKPSEQVKAVIEQSAA